jgi:hypothetical protein
VQAGPDDVLFTNILKLINRAFQNNGCLLPLTSCCLPEAVQNRDSSENIVRGGRTHADPDGPLVSVL